MPTLAKPQLTESPSAWGAASDEMYQELCRDRVTILTELRFYAKRDLLPPDVNSSAIPTKNEEEELRQIGGALAVAAEASGIMSTAVLVATLRKVSKNPNLFFCDYQRGEEALGTRWRDVWGDQVARFPGAVEQPT